jgi:sugar transferase (PEP-CTERM/EpsH1 system associated)
MHVIHHLVVGGMENGLVNLINRMPGHAYGHAIVCVEDYSDFRRRITRPDVEVIALHRSRIGVWALRRELYRVCRRLKPTILHSRNLSGLDALLPARLAGVPRAVHGEHGWDVDDLSGARIRPALLRRLHAPLVSRYITVSKDLEHYLVRRVGIDERRISQIYNGVDTARFAPAPGDRRVALPPGFCPVGAIVVGTVGRLQPVKDQATLLHAFAALTGRRPELRKLLRLAIIGDGPKLDELRQLAHGLDIGAATWFAGALGSVHEVLQALDVFVLPSLNEGISNTVLEAMASGLPVLATAVGGNIELIREGVNGRTFPAGDAEALATLLADYIDRPALRAAHGRAARQIAEENFSLDAMTHRYTAVYDALCGRRR